MKPKPPLAVCPCNVDIVPRLPAVLEHGGFQVWRNQSTAPARFDYAVSDGTRRVALKVVNGVAEEKVLLVLGRMRFEWKLRALFGRKKFVAAVVACLQRATRGDPDEGFEGAGVLAPLRPPPSVLSAAAATELPRAGDEGEAYA